MRSSTWRTIMLLSLTLVLVSTAMDAQAARRSSLAGNQFINDADDMFAFPQLLMKYKNRVIIDMAPGADGENGNASIIFGDNMVWNFNTGRSDFLNNTAAWAGGSADRNSFGLDFLNGTPGSNFSDGNSLEWWDLGFATHLGDTPFGVNISWAKDNDKFTQADGTVTTDNSSHMLSLQAGVTLGFAELAGEVGFGSYKDKMLTVAPTDQNDWDFFNFSLLARGDLEDLGGLDWRWIAAYVNGSNESKAAGMEKLTTTGFRGSFGPVWGTPGEWEVATYMNFAYSSQDEVNGFTGEVTNSTMTGFPAYNMAMEYYLNSWLVARGGVMSSSFTDTEKVALVAGETEENERDYLFMWTMGLGVDKGMWGLDLALNESDVHSGYLPLNGDVGTTPIAYMTAWLAW